jgi:hypothetical protein
MKPFLLTLSALCLAISSWHYAIAAPTTTPIRNEIEGLLTRLEKSGCHFNRNGSWYSGAEAKAHLMRKLAYIEDKGTLKNTEQFIDLAATKSSFSGDAYQVKCANAPVLSSQQWLLRELWVFRGKGNIKP